MVEVGVELSKELVSTSILDQSRPVMVPLLVLEVVLMLVVVVVVGEDDFSFEFEVHQKMGEFERTRNIWYLSVDKESVRVMIEGYPGSFP